MKLLDGFSSLVDAVGGPRGLAYRPYSRACCACIFLFVVLVVSAVLVAILVLHR